MKIQKKNYNDTKKLLETLKEKAREKYAEKDDEIVQIKERAKEVVDKFKLEKDT